MKVLRNFVIVSLLVGCYGATLSAQCGNWNNSPDKAEAENAHLLYRQYIEGKQAADIAQLDNETFNIMYQNWEKAYQLAPAADGQLPVHYVDGREILKTLAAKETDESKKNEYNERILQLYDEQMTCYGNEAHLLGRKAHDMFYMPTYGYRMATFDAFKKAMEVAGNDTEYIVLEPMTQLMVYLYKNKQLDRSEVQQRYTQMEAIADYNIANNKNKTYYESAKAGMQAQLAEVKDDDPAVTMETEIRTDDPCDDGRKLQELGKYEEAIARYNECIATNDDPEVLAQVYYNIAFIQIWELGDYSTARTNTQKAASYKEDWGLPYILIGDMYAKASRSCGDTWGASLAVLAALEKYEYAKSIDASVIEVADKRIDSYSGAIPIKADGFMRGIKAGQPVRVPCWIGETVTVRFQE